MEGSGFSNTNFWRQYSNGPDVAALGRVRADAVESAARGDDSASPATTPRAGKTPSWPELSGRVWTTDLAPWLLLDGRQITPVLAAGAGDIQHRPRRALCEHLDRILLSDDSSQTLVVPPVRPDGRLQA